MIRFFFLLSLISPFAAHAESALDAAKALSGHYDGEWEAFGIGPDGKIQHIFEKVKPDGHADEVLDYLKESAEGAA